MKQITDTVSERNVRANIRHQMWQQRITIKQLAQSAGLSVYKAANLRTGQRRILLIDVIAAARALNLPLGTLFAGPITDTVTSEVIS